MTPSLPGLRAIGLCFCLALLAVSTSASALSSISVDIGEMHSAAGAARNVRLDYQLGGKLDLQGEVKPGADAKWTAAHLQCDALAMPVPGQWRCEDGRIDSVNIKGGWSLALRLPQTRQGLDASLQLRDASFSDAAGLHAGEKVSASLELNATPINRGWQWQSSVDWQAGEVFWQPFYFASGGHRLQAEGRLDDQFLTLTSVNLILDKVGHAKARGQ